MTELSVCCFNARSRNLSLLQMDDCSFLFCISQDRLVTLCLIIVVVSFQPEIKHAYHVPGLFTEPGGTITVTGLT